jgi:hypothetical protein
MKALLLLLGLGTGAAGTASWLLSLPDAAAQPAVPSSGDDLRQRLHLLRARFAEAIAEGQIAGEETERRLRRELDAYRGGAFS